jgi:hypothetical protein
MAETPDPGNLESPRSPSRTRNASFRDRWKRQQTKPQTWWRRYRWLRWLFAVSTALAVIPLLGLISVVTHAPDVPLRTLDNSTKPAPPLLSTACLNDHDEDGINIIVSLNNSDLQMGTTSLDVGLCIGRHVSCRLRQQRERELIFEIHGAQPPLPQAVRVSDAPPALPTSYTHYQPIGPATVSIGGDPRRYPLDSYIGALQWSLTAQNVPPGTDRSAPLPQNCISSGTSTLTGASSGSTSQNGTPARTSGQNPGASTPTPVPSSFGLTKRSFRSVTFVAGGASAFEWSSQQVNLRGYPSPHTQQMTFGASIEFGGKRPFLTIKLFVLALLAVLFALVLLLIVRMIRRPPLTVDSVAIVGAMLIAVLPVRLVLVPGAIGSLTLVDYMLALQMALLVAGLIVAVLRSDPSLPDEDDKIRVEILPSDPPDGNTRLIVKIPRRDPDPSHELTRTDRPESAGDHE